MKKISLIIASIFLTLLVSTPLMIDLIHVDEEFSILIDVDEEDKSENKKDLELQDLFFTDFIESNTLAEIQNLSLFEDYLVSVVSFPLEVISPPPKVI